MVETVTTTDLYESTYYLLSGCELALIEGVPVNGKITCRLTFRGSQITRLQLEYFQSRAMVNLMAFRRAWGQVTALVHSVKKKGKPQAPRVPGDAEEPEGGER